jgi:hypothetical protein
MVQRWAEIKRRRLARENKRASKGEETGKRNETEREKNSVTRRGRQES